MESNCLLLLLLWSWLTITLSLEELSVVFSGDRVGDRSGDAVVDTEGVVVGVVLTDTSAIEEALGFSRGVEASPSSLTGVATTSPFEDGGASSLTVSLFPSLLEMILFGAGLFVAAASSFGLLLLLLLLVLLLSVLAA